MRTSNKILLGTFIVILFIITSVHLAIYAKYKSNSFTTGQVLHEERYDSKSLAGVQSVSLSGLQNVTIIPSDTPHTEIAKSGDRILSYEFANGVLTIKGDTTIMENNREERLKSWRDVILYLPFTQNIKADNCEITIKGGLDSAKAPSITASMNETTLHLGFWQKSDHEAGNYFNTISFTKYSHGNLDVSENASVKEMDLDMEQSGFEDNNASFQKISLNADSHSTLKLNAQNLSKAKFTLK
ncbi:MAG: hypothetical protein QM764_11900 [Chitinophagaceae bacterium]